MNNSKDAQIGNSKKMNKKVHPRIFGFSQKLEPILSAVRPRLKELKHSLILIKRSPLALIGLAIVMGIIAIAIAAPILAPVPKGQVDPLQIPKTFQAPVPPGAQGHLLGTGVEGEDIYYGIIWGSRTSITIALFVVLTSAFIGIILGAVSGYYGGRIDDLLMRVTDIFLSVPALIMAMAVVTI